MPAADRFTFLLYNLASGAKIDEIPFTSFEWTDTLDAPGVF